MCCDVTLQQYDTLRLLLPGARSNTELAQALGIDLSTASRNLAKLEAAGYVDRVEVPGDARAWANRLSRKGRACVDGMLDEERDVFGAILQRLPDTRRAAARALLLELVGAVEAESDARSGCDCRAVSRPRPEG